MTTPFPPAAHVPPPPPSAGGSGPSSPRHDNLGSASGSQGTGRGIPGLGRGQDININNIRQEAGGMAGKKKDSFACVGRRGFGVAVKAANSCIDYMSLYEDSENLQCIWIRCNKALFGFEDDVMLCAAYFQGAQFSRDDVTNLYFTSKVQLFDEFLCAAQVVLHSLSCRDYNAKIGGLSEGGCGSKMVLKRNPECAKEYAEVLANNTKKFRSNLNRQLMKKRKVFRETVQSGQAEHACKFARKQFRATARRAKRAYTKHQKAEFLGRLYSKNPELHAMLRQPKRAQIIPLAEPAWVAYLNEHFCPSTHPQPHRPHHGRQGLLAREIAVPLGRNYPPPEVLLRQGARAGWIPEPDSATVCLGVHHQNSMGEVQRMSIFWSPLWLSFSSCFMKARIPACWKHAKLSPLYKKGPLLDPNSYRMLAVSGTIYSLYILRIYANVVRASLTDWCQEANKIPGAQFGSWPQYTSAYVYTSPSAACCTHCATKQFK
eukprot:1161999-Pelagomonas_calceolata.AAC.2